MAEHQVNPNEAGQADFNVHARDYVRVMKMLKYGTFAAIIGTVFVLLIIAN